MPYIVIGAIAAAVAIVVLLLVMRKRRRPETAAATAPAQPIPQASIAAPPTVTADKFCMNCGATLPAHATFCNKCGSKQ
jgi:membrane protease subunit (stomatin/prohibitin family)